MDSPSITNSKPVRQVSCDPDEPPAKWYIILAGAILFIMVLLASILIFCMLRDHPKFPAHHRNATLEFNSRVAAFLFMATY